MHLNPECRVPTPRLPGIRQFVNALRLEVGRGGVIRFGKLRTLEVYMGHSLNSILLPARYTAFLESRPRSSMCGPARMRL